MTRRALALALVLAVPSLGASPAFAQTAQLPAAAATATPLAASVTEAAQRFGIPESWIWGVMAVESRGHPRAVSPKGAMGLMQLMPATWATLTARHGLGGDPFDIRANVIAGAAYLRELWDRYGNIPAMLAAYNAGPRRADAWASGRGSLPAETRSYVARIAPGIGISGGPSAAAVPVNRPFVTAVSWRAAGLFTQPASAPPHRVDAGGNDAVAMHGVGLRPATPFVGRRTRDGLFVARSEGGQP